MLLWLCYHDDIPTADFRLRRGMASLNLCDRCHQNIEDILHCFFSCLKALQIWRDRNNDIFNPSDKWSLEKVICETDCLEAFSPVNYDLSSMMDHRDLVSKIKDTKLLPWSMHINFIQRSANTAADFLAKQAASSQLVYTEWSLPSDDLKHVIHEDSVS
ncbi:hypothetical protein PIB30_000602 [Stylosanthes scabra]|uniref:Reverse transcriptase zinc-binding domain-containing protein n=1 Tax=Stylosanthes scabra TaxID=79078 RepID=A0ABU6X028_9FABA|nr:hypothetical protein [Stylosanthes scabra]